MSIEGDRYTITLTGEVDLSARHLLDELVAACLEAGAALLRFDMRGVTFCDSTGVHALLKAARLDVPVEVVPSAAVLRTLETAGVTHILRVVIDGG